MPLPLHLTLHLLYSILTFDIITLVMQWVMSIRSEKIEFEVTTSANSWVRASDSRGSAGIRLVLQLGGMVFDEPADEMLVRKGIGLNGWTGS